MTSNSYDLVVVGAGPGGYVAAIRAAQLGRRVAIVERAQLGGICLNWGCIPTKALLRSAEVHHLLQSAAEFGVHVEGVSADWSAMVTRSRQVAGQLSAGVAHLLKKNHVELVVGDASLTSPNTLRVRNSDDSERELATKNILLATGARARELSGLTVDGDRVWNYRHAMTATELPKSLLIVGSGAIGIEFASVYNELGVDVTVVEMAERILPNEDVDVSAFAYQAFQDRGIRFSLCARVTAINNKSDGLEVLLETSDGEKHLSVERVLVAAGVVGNVEGLGLEALGVETTAHAIVTNQWGQTNIGSIRAIGDVAGGPWLAHKASHEAIAVVEHIFGHGNPHPINRLNIPGCTYSFPQIASVGLTERQALDADYKVRTGTFPFLGNGKAIALGEAKGFVKTVVDDATGEILGAHMVGPEVTELIASFVLARELEATEEELAATIFPHPTLSEALHESILAAGQKALHI